MNVVRSHGAEAGEDLGEGRHDVVFQVAARGRAASECRAVFSLCRSADHSIFGGLNEVSKVEFVCQKSSSPLAPSSFDMA